MASTAQPKMGIVEQIQNLSGGPRIIATLSIASLYIMASASIIQVNKYLITGDRFPFSPVLSCLHMFTSFVGALIMYQVCPHLFTAMPTLNIDQAFLLKFVPLGAFFAGSIVLSNMSYMYISVAFIQMLKELNLAFIFSLSLAVGVEKWSKTAFIILSGLTICIVVAAKGEIHFVLLGVAIQLISQLCEVSKIVTQNILMSNKEGPATKLDPLTTVLFMAPMCFGFSVLIYLANMEAMPPSLVISHAMTCWPSLLMSCINAFVLNVVICLTIATMNGVGYAMVGIAKDIEIVTSSALFLGDTISLLQFGGFAGSIVFMGGYSAYKLNMQHFKDDDCIAGFKAILDESMSKANEKEKLLP